MTDTMKTVDIETCPYCNCPASDTGHFCPGPDTGEAGWQKVPKEELKSTTAPSALEKELTQLRTELAAARERERVMREAAQEALVGIGAVKFSLMPEIAPGLLSQLLKAHDMLHSALSTAGTVAGDGWQAFQDRIRALESDLRNAGHDCHADFVKQADFPSVHAARKQEGEV